MLNGQEVLQHATIPTFSVTELHWKDFFPKIIEKKESNQTWPNSWSILTKYYDIWHYIKAQLSKYVVY